MTLRTRLLLAQAPLAVGLVLVGLVALNTLDTLGQSSQLILRDNFRSVLAAQRMKDAVERVDNAAAFRAAGRPDKADEQAPANIRAFESQLEAQERNITEPGEAEATQRLRAAWNEDMAKYDAYRRIRDEQELRRRYFDELHPAFLRVKEAAERVLEINQDAMLLKSERARGTAERNRTLLLLAISSALGLGLLASVSLTRRALRPLQLLSLAVRRIGEGDLDARARIEGKDEIAQVGRELDTMADKLSQYRSSSLGELLQAQQASQAAIDSLPDPVIVLSLDGQVLNVNQAAENLLRLEAGRDPLSRLPPQLREAMDKIRAHIFAGKGSYAPRGVEEAMRVEGEGGGRALLPRATPLYSEQGNVTGASIVLQDVTRLLRFDELKNDLVATVAHEFRTPLTSMRMAVHILLEGIVGPLNDKQLDLVGAARDDCERLQGIVEDLLDLSHPGRQGRGVAHRAAGQDDPRRRGGRERGCRARRGIEARGRPARAGAAGARRPGPHQPRLRQPGGKRDPAQPEGKPDRGARAAGEGTGAVRGRGPGSGNSGRVPAAHLREVLPHARNQGGGHRSRALHLARDRRRAWR